MNDDKPPTLSADALATLDDDALVAQAKQDLQGQTAFAELYRRHVTQVYRFLLARVGSVEDAQDLTSQTFLAALEALPKFRGRSKFTTWLLGIARNKAVDHLRKQRPVASIELAEEIPSPASEKIDETVEQNLQLEAVIRVMKVLSPDRAEALALHSFGGLTSAQVAEVMDRSDTAVRMLIHRAIKDIQQRLNVNLQERTS